MDRKTIIATYTLRNNCIRTCMLTTKCKKYNSKLFSGGQTHKIILLLTRKTLQKYGTCIQCTCTYGYLLFNNCPQCRCNGVDVDTPVNKIWFQWKHRLRWGPDRAKHSGRWQETLAARFNKVPGEKCPERCDQKKQPPSNRFVFSFYVTLFSQIEHVNKPQAKNVTNYLVCTTIKILINNEIECVCVCATTRIQNCARDI